ncbi:MAG: hypothetical protein HY961_18820 [Ignavibacteriae bacterium]|nr:hypothetical protein [Ignavibacteriota bacterium]
MSAETTTMFVTAHFPAVTATEPTQSAVTESERLVSSTSPRLNEKARLPEEPISQTRISHILITALGVRLFP